jgi:hypothetical protein
MNGLILSITHAMSMKLKALSRALVEAKTYGDVLFALASAMSQSGAKNLCGRPLKFSGNQRTSFLGLLIIREFNGFSKPNDPDTLEGF